MVAFAVDEQQGGVSVRDGLIPVVATTHLRSVILFLPSIGRRKKNAINGLSLKCNSFIYYFVYCKIRFVLHKGISLHNEFVRCMCVKDRT